MAVMKLLPYKIPFNLIIMLLRKRDMSVQFQVKGKYHMRHYTAMTAIIPPFCLKHKHSRD
jgi:hypothetical protein